MYLPLSPLHLCQCVLPSLVLPWMNCHVIQVISSTFGLDLFVQASQGTSLLQLSPFLSFPSPLGHHISMCYGLNICVLSPPHSYVGP